MSWGLGIASFVAAFVAARLLAGPFARLALDRPNARSMHEKPVPRTGGIAILAGMGVAAAWTFAELWLPMALAAALAGLSLLDDVRGLPSALRLAAHGAAAGTIVWSFAPPLEAPALVVLAVAIAWITNAYNFMDGSDGLAGGMAVIGFGAYAAAAHLAGQGALALLSLALAAASAAFLVHNFHPARIFLGDVGSIPLGFLAGALGLVGWRNEAWPLWFPVLVFGPFIGDATLTLFKRIARRERVWQAHREHYYQRLVRMGFGHRGTAWIGYAVMAGCGAVALSFRDQPSSRQAAALGLSVAALAAIAVWVDVRWARFVREGGGTA